MRQERGFIINIVAIVVVLSIVFFSQQANITAQSKQVTEGAEGVFNKPIDWIKNSLQAKVSGEVEEKSKVITEEITKQKNSAAQQIWNAIKNSLQNKFNAFFKSDVE